jgi:hypothetical protein
MAERIPQSVAKLVVFRAFLASDGKTPATGKTIAITLSKNGGAFGNPNAGATNATELSSGFYKVSLDTTDTGTVGPLAIRGAEGTINDVGDVFEVVKATNAGFSALPDAAAEASGGLATLSAAQAANGTINANLHRWLTGTPNALASGRVDSSLGAVADAAGIRSAVGLASANLDTQLDALPTGLETAVLVAAAITSDHGSGSYVRNTEPPSAATTAAAVRTELAVELAHVDADVSSRSAFDATAALPDAVAADGAMPTAEQALYAIYQFLTERAVVGTTLTVRKPDGSTTLMTFTLDDATAPTSLTRAT